MIKKNIMRSLAAIGLAVGLALSATTPAQAATGLNQVYRGCSLGQQIAISVTSTGSTNVVRGVYPSSGGWVQGPSVPAGGSSTWYSGVRFGTASIDSTTTYGYSVFCA